MQRLQKRATSLIRDIGIVTALLLTNGFYYCEGKYLPGYMDLIRIAFGLLLVFTLVSFSFWNGFLNRIGFAAYLLVIFLLPQAGILLLVGQSAVKGLGRLLYDSSILLGDWPFAALGSALHLSPRLTAFLCLFISLAAFGVGIFLKLRYPRSKRQEIEGTGKKDPVT